MNNNHFAGENHLSIVWQLQE
uniref:Uncharacterized protein n=1 Tax=Lepeophtheirus salmonis TaxID=72036 RepID=A0A0K2VJM0_LEPSM